MKYTYHDIKKRSLKRFAFVTLGLALVFQPVKGVDTGTAELEALPEGATGVASKYPADKGIEKDPAVILADDFEGHKDKSDLKLKWNSVYNHTSLTRDKKNVYLGKQAIEFGSPKDRNTASGVALYLLLEQQKSEVMFLRYYSKFASNYDVMGGAHNGGGLSAGMYHMGKSSSGIKTNGKNHYATVLDHGRWKDFGPVPNPGYLGAYVYHVDQRHRWGDGFFPDGMVVPYSSEPTDFGPHFVKRSHLVSELDKWHCYEVMLKANTPGKRDGRVAGWVEGKLVMDFPNLRFRDVESLKIDHIQIGLSISASKHPATSLWYDNVVAATSYIGPVKQ